MYSTCLCSNVRALVAKLVKTSNWDSEDPGLNLPRIAQDFRTKSTEDLSKILSDYLIARSCKNRRQQTPEDSYKKILANIILVTLAKSLT